MNLDPKLITHQKTALAGGFNAMVDNKLSIVSPLELIKVCRKIPKKSKINTSMDQTGSLLSQSIVPFSCTMSEPEFYTRSNSRRLIDYHRNLSL